LTYESVKVFPKTQKYIQGIAGYVMKQNPQTFKGNISPDQFCLNVEFGHGFSAEAKPSQRNIIISTAVLQSIQSDAELAAVIAHELAHITMLHTRIKHPEFKHTAESKQLIQQNADVIKKINQHLEATKSLQYSILTEIRKNKKSRSLDLDFLDVFESMFSFDASKSDESAKRTYFAKRDLYLSRLPKTVSDKIKGSMDRIATISLESAELLAVYKQTKEKLVALYSLDQGIGPEAAANWQEQEADEVGFEFYRRAGFKDASFFNILSILAAKTMSPQEISQCMANNFKAIATKNLSLEPTRGSGTHPEACWRIFNNAREKILHEKDYQNFANDLVSVSGSGLREALSEVDADRRHDVFKVEDLEIFIPPR
jgi:hypothetical protein